MILDSGLLFGPSCMVPATQAVYILLVSYLFTYERSCWRRTSAAGWRQTTVGWRWLHHRTIDALTRCLRWSALNWNNCAPDCTRLTAAESSCHSVVQSIMSNLLTPNSFRPYYDLSSARSGLQKYRYTSAILL